MIRRCREAGLRELEFRVTDGFTLTIPRRLVPKTKTLVKTPVEIIRLLQENPNLTLAEIAVEIGKSLSAVERASARLIKAGHLKYVGPRKGGHWVVLNFRKLR